MESRSKPQQTLRDRLSQWETSLAPLTERQKKSYLELSTIAVSRPMPPDVCGLSSVRILCHNCFYLVNSQ